MARCECDNHEKEYGKPCDREAEQYPNVVCSPALCIPCLHCCYE